MAPIEPVTYLMLVKLLASKMRRRIGWFACVEELISDGWLGLLRAIRTFDPRRNVPFDAFARLHIRGAIREGLRERDLVPRTWRHSHGFVPKFLPLSQEHLAQDPPPPAIDGREWLARTLPKLSARQQLIIELYYLQRLTMKQIARRFGITEARVSQLHRKIIQKLRDFADAETRRPRGFRRVPRGVGNWR